MQGGARRLLPNINMDIHLTLHRLFVIATTTYTYTLHTTPPQASFFDFFATINQLETGLGVPAVT